MCSFVSVFSEREKYIFFECSLTRNDGLLAVVALGGVFVGVALGTQQLLVLGGERFVHQRALTLEAVETGLMPVAVFI